MYFFDNFDYSHDGNEFDYVDIYMHKFKDGSTVYRFFDTNNDEVILQDQEAGLKKGNDPMRYYEGYEEKTEEYFRYIVGKLKSSKRIRLTSYGGQNSDITYLSEEQMLKTLE